MAQVLSQNYINRELSWLRFNTRVLNQCNKDMPLIEKLKFIAIYTTNLDEFYMIRVAGLKQLFAAGVVVSGNDGISPIQQLREIRKYLQNEKTTLENHYINVKKELGKNGLFIKNYDELSVVLKSKADEYFFSNIMPIIVPIAVDSTHPFPHLNNLSFSLAVKLIDPEHSEHTKFGMIRISRVLPRFFEADENTYVPIESIVRKYAEEIFPGYKLLSSAAFKVTRNADIMIEEEEADDFMMILEQGLKMRRKGAFVRLQIEANTDPEILEFLNSHMKIFQKDIYEYSVPLTLDSLWQIVGNKNFSHLGLPLYTPKILPPFDENSSIFDTLDKGDALTFQPYESFEPVTQLIKEAAKDPRVISIRMTLYRVEKNSPIVQALVDAASEGKQVTVMVELKARFDEENNLHWAKALENSGAHVIYGITGFKVHAKITQIIRQVGDKLKFYMHFSTGNYNGSSAKIYTDISYFTTKDEFIKDSTTFFHILSGYNKNRFLTNLSMSPMQIKNRLLDMIKAETLQGKNGKIIAKMNALVDGDMIDALYEASKAGVKIDLIVRGICCLRPNVARLSENINVISIIGKYLEHARIFYFKHAMPQFYISSADWMPRNLERRFELMSPIYEKKHQEILFEILDTQLKDNVLSYKLKNDGEYEQILAKDGEEKINNHAVFEKIVARLKRQKTGEKNAKNLSKKG